MLLPGVVYCPTASQVEPSGEPRGVLAYSGPDNWCANAFASSALAPRCRAFLLCSGAHALCPLGTDANAFQERALSRVAARQGADWPAVRIRPVDRQVLP